MPKSKNGKHKPTPGGITRAVIYRRTSTERQGERVSPVVQLSDCETYAKEHGYTVVAVYSDVERYKVRGKPVEPSGTRTDRPGFAQMLADGEAGGYDVLIAWKEDRLYRGVKPAVLVDEMIESAGIRVELVKETWDRKMLFIKAAIGRLELENIRDRTNMGRLARVQAGMHHGGRLPRGYRAVRNGQGRTTGYEVDPAWRPFFDELARLFLARYSYEQMARMLGTNPYTGHRWQSGSIHVLLTNPFYLGRVTYGRYLEADNQTYAGVQPPAWDDAMCRSIEHELARREGMGKGAPRTHDGLFSGVARCGICGRMMITGYCQQKLKNRTARYRYYACWRDVYIRQGLINGPKHGPNYLSERKLLAQYREYVATITPEMIAAFLAAMVPGGDAAPDQGLAAALQRELDDNTAKLADLAVGLEGVRLASPAAMEAILAELRRTGQASDRLRARIADLERQRRAGPDLEAARDSMLRIARDPATFDLPRGELRLVLQAIPALFIAKGKLVEPVEKWP